MPEDEYDLAGFAVGVCDKKEMITGEELKAGDVLIAPRRFASVDFPLPLVPSIAIFISASFYLI